VSLSVDEPPPAMIAAFLESLCRGHLVALAVLHVACSQPSDEGGVGAALLQRGLALHPGHVNNINLVRVESAIPSLTSTFCHPTSF